MELQGTIKKITDIQTFSSGFQKRELILITQEQYPQPICIEFLSEKVSILDSFSEGDQVKIGINLRGREWTSPDGITKYFNSIVGWRIEKISSDDSPEPTKATPQTEPKIASTNSTNINENPFSDEDEDEDGLPF